jgi:hypothetical protein
MNLPLPMDATREEVVTALELYANAVTNMAKVLLEDMGPILQEIPKLTDILDRLISLASNIQQLTSRNIRNKRAVSRIMCHLLCLIDAANNLISPIKIEDYAELIDDVYKNARGVLEACRHVA